MTDIIGRLTTSLADRYQIERELGQGGMAIVYLANDLRHNRKVALKVLRPELAAILGGDRFLKEIQLTANLQHPHILPLHDSGEVEGIVYYVMPYIEGESLRDRLNRDKQLPVDDAVRIAKEIASALDYAHRHNVVHRDIKPENILLHDGQAIVADFGIALAVSTVGGGTRMTETGMSLGTPHYMAPEQAMGDREITPRADIYALGCVLYESLTGDPPFTGSTAQAIVARVVTENPRSLTSQRHTIPPHVEATVMKALEKLPADRFASAAEFAAALNNPSFIGTSASIAARAQSPRRRALGAIPWVLLLIAVPLAAWGWLRRHEVPAPVVSRNRIVLRTTPLGAGGMRSVAVSPQGDLIVFPDTVGGVRQLWAKHRGRLDPTPITGTATTAPLVTGPTFSPDGQWIAFVTERRLKKVPRAGGSAITLADSMNEAYPAIAWLDNDSIAFNTTTYGLRLIGSDGGPSRLLWSADSGRGIVSATPLPGGRGLLVGACRPGCTEVQLRSIGFGARPSRVLYDETTKAWYTSNGTIVFTRQDGGVFSVPFDLDSLALRGAPVPVLEGVRTIPGRADFLLGAGGTLLYIPGSATSTGTPTELTWVGRDGTASAAEPGWTFVPSTDVGMALSPDARRLAVGIRTGNATDVWIKQLNGGPLTRLTFDGINTRPEWTADGQTVMYISRAPTRNEDVRSRRADGTGSEVTLVDAARAIFEVVRTRDTNSLLIRTTLPPSRDLFLWRRGSDSALVPLLAASGYDEVAPALSPDGRWLAYVSNESGRGEIYVRPFPGVDAGRWQISRDGGVEPLWSHSGRELFFREPAGNLIATEVRPGTSFVTEAQRVLFPVRDYYTGGNHTQYRITPDDRRFLFLRPLRTAGAEEPTFIVQVENWLSELPTAGGTRP